MIDATVAATVALAVIALLQLFVFAWQGLQLKRTVGVAVRSEIPKVALSNITFGRQGSSDPFDNTKLPLLTVSFRNHGKQAARIIEASLEMSLYSEFPKKPRYKNKTSAPVGRVIEAGKTYTFPSRTWYEPKALEKLSLCAGAQSKDVFCVYGFVAYLDDFGTRHETGFLAWWNTTGGSYGWDEIIDPKLQGTTFVAANDRRYTYDIAVRGNRLFFWKPRSRALNS
jgi:hypothetical protein